MLEIYVEMSLVYLWLDSNDLILVPDLIIFIDGISGVKSTCKDWFAVFCFVFLHDFLAAITGQCNKVYHFGINLNFWYHLPFT